LHDHTQTASNRETGSVGVAPARIVCATAEKNKEKSSACFFFDANLKAPARIFRQECICVLNPEKLEGRILSF
jgi:hypothetical protein